ncbi:MAG: alpha/beta fold hydrolase [Pseudomonadota bacterium]
MTGRRKWLAIAVGLIVFGLVLSWTLGNALVRPAASAVPAAIAPVRDFNLAASDGLRIAATYWPGRTPDAPGILLLHGNGASRAMVADNAQWLAGQGYAVLTIDFRGHGESTLAPRSFGLFESRDAAAAFAWLKRSQRGAKVAVLGISLGGAASLLGDGGPLPADALILQAVYPDIRRAIRNRIAASMTAVPAHAVEPLLSFQSRLRYGVWPGRIAPLAALRAYRGPVLVIGGAQDRYTPPAETREMFAAAPGPKALWLVEGLDHAHVSDLRTPAWRARILAFLQGTIGAP